MTLVDWSPNLPCPKGCKPWDNGPTFFRQSVVWMMNRNTGSASSECVLCQHNFVWDFNPDIPFEHQPIFFRTNPRIQTLNGVVSKRSLPRMSDKKGKGDTRPTDDDSKPNVP